MSRVSLAIATPAAVMMFTTVGRTVSLMNGDAQTAREWASKALDNDLLNEVPLEGYRAAARYILATTTPPTMADIAWDDDAHAGLCAESTDDGVVRMIGPDWVNDHADHILCRLLPGGIDSLPMSTLTPLPGTRVDLTPRREPEATPAHPAVLITEEDYEDAPNGTVVWGSGPSSNMRSSLDKHGNAWLEAGDDGTFIPRDMAAVGPHQVLRWGEAL